MPASEAPTEATNFSGRNRSNSQAWSLFRTNYGITTGGEYDAQKLEEAMMVNNEVVGGAYDLDKVISWKVFGILDGTVLRNNNLWKETLINGAIYWLVFGGVLFFRFDGFRAFLGKESAIRAFIAMFSTLIGLLLSFYTALNLGRWWQMRQGVENMEDGCKNLTMMISQGVSQDEQLLHTINRYARCSLFLIFATSETNAEEDPAKRIAPRLKALKAGLLTQEESDLLENMEPHCPWVHAETLWVWLANVVTRLHDAGLTKGAPHYCALLNAIEQGRSGVTTIKTFLETPIPLGYVHLLCLMVKLHNFILTVLMALACVMLAGGSHGLDPVGMCRTSFRAFFMPFLYNAILILNSEVVDPFGGSGGNTDDFDWRVLNLNIKEGSRSYIGAAKNLPDWLSGHSFGTPEFSARS